ncbi:hypothetical protein SAMN05216315_11239 [Nitrosospira sp. Nsp18]|uniref:Ig-like domain-containing protein n=1 Tax=Nitrosospira sp. Nsp18 TaxID=1855334 RepID=UPI000886EE13|nr:Ig-like domain-containing protein [Nitrosospira sp. Nsp18]SDA19773.1 hypothetical protein SAMN05216315_11239 [Nitrosospira sp. Nsp18]
MGYDSTVCNQKLTQQGMLPLCGGDYHCQDVVNQSASYHSLCGNGGDATMYTPVQCTACTNGQSYLYFPAPTFFAQCAAQGTGWGPSFCYCCCSCFANDTVIAIPGGGKAIYLFTVGEAVMAGSADSSDGKLGINWAEAVVNFSAGTGSKGHQPMMVYISLTGKTPHELICSTDQVFLLADGKYTRAEKLRPGQQLVDKDGDPVSLDLISIGSYDGGVHHISTDQAWHKKPDGHLLLAGGVVAGDYTLQLYFDQLPAEMKEDGYEAKPTLGTPGYDTTHANTVKRAEALFEFVGSNMKSQDVGRRIMAAGLFKTYSVATAYIPYGAQALFTQDQAADIAKNGSQAPISNNISQGTFNTIVKQFAGFYPDIDFYFDILDIVPNLYAFEYLGRQTVVVSGGLGRMKGFNYEGMFMAMAHGISCFYGGEPKNSFGYSGVGQADWYAFGVIGKLCWSSAPAMAYLLEARKQWAALFELVSPANAKGNPNDPLNDPSLACRSQTVDVAIAGGNLPECAGGESLSKISLQQAAAISDSDVVLNFSLALDDASGTNVANYSLNPDAKVTSATLDTVTGFIVHLKADLEPNTEYEVTVKNLVSILGTGLDPEHTSVGFTSPEQ